MLENYFLVYSQHSTSVLILLLLIHRLAGLFICMKGFCSVRGLLSIRYICFQTFILKIITLQHVFCILIHLNTVEGYIILSLSH